MVREANGTRIDRQGSADARGAPFPTSRPAGTRSSPWRAVPGAVLVFGLSCGVFGLSTRVITLPPTWRTFEFCQYAEIGRNLAVEGTFDTRLVEPMALALLDRDRIGPPAGRWPVVNRYPLPCLVVAGLMRALGPGEKAAAWSNGLAISLLAALSYALARRWYGPGWAAVVGLLFLANPSFYGEFILLGTPDVWFATLFVLELLVWSRLDPSTGARPRLGWALGLGGIGALVLLTRFNALLFLAVQAAVLLGRRRGREVVVMALTATAVTAPMWAYNWSHFHRPVVSLYSTWNLLDGIGAYRVEPWLYYRVPDVPAELSAHLGGLARKFATNLFTRVPLRVWSLWRLDLLWPLALIGLAWARPSAGAGRFAAWAAGLFALQLVVFSALRLELEDRGSPHHGRYFFWFAAPVLLLAVGTLRRLSDRSRACRWLAAAVVLAQLSLFGTAWRDLIERHRAGSNIGRDPIRRMLTEVVEGRVIASNQPQITAWFCGLRSISLPADPTELARLNRTSPTPADYLFIDINSNFIDLDRRWFLLARNNPREASPWEAGLLRDYQYVLSPARTRPLMYVLLRRRGVPPSRLEQHFQRPSGT